MNSHRTPFFHRLALSGGLLAALVVAAIPATSQAVQISYDVVLTDTSGPSGAGSFVYDDVLGQVLDFQITLDDFGPFTPVGICDGCPFDYSVADTAALFDLPASNTFLQQEQIAFQGGRITLLLNADGSYGEFNGRADGSYAFVRSDDGTPAVPEPSGALMFMVGSGVIGFARRRGLVRA
jgi:hypothetical protein